MNTLPFISLTVMKFVRVFRNFITVVKKIVYIFRNIRINDEIIYLMVNLIYSTPKALNTASSGL